MKNPLRKRLPRELKGDLAKYAIIFIFVITAIGFVSGFLVADNSLIHAYDESFEKYNIEDGHFQLSAEPDKEFLTRLSDETGAELYPLWYKEAETSDGHTLRLYKERKQVDLVSLHKGRLPRSEGEITLDRLYAENNGLDVGDEIVADDETYTVCGLTAFSDYSALFRKNTDSMFDAQRFSVSIACDEDFDRISGETQYVYAWKGELSVEEAAETAAACGLQLTDFLEEKTNQAIHFTGDDMGGDEQMIVWLMYIVMAILAFVFGVATSNTIEQEAQVIGTLRATGYSKAMLIRHYLVLPVVVTVAGAVIGNLLAYTVMKDYMADLYYGSYSLPPYETLWSSYAFVLTTAAPAAIMLVVNLIILTRKLSIRPLDFLRRELSGRRGGKRAVRLPGFRFLSRFRLRVILQNKGAYCMLFIGILFVNVLLMFGMMMTPLIEHQGETVEKSMFSKYQYVMAAPAETENREAEKYALRSLEIDNDLKEGVSVYGVEAGSAYLDKADFPVKEGDVLVSNGYLEKYGLQEGDEITLREPFDDDTYTFRIAGSYQYPAGFALFMEKEAFCKFFGEDEGYYTGYFSDEKLDDLPDEAVATIITQKDLNIMAEQLMDSMGGVFPLFCGFSVLIYLLILFLMAKMVIEKNASAISMVKILGYEDGEISSIYGRATAVVVVVSLLVTVPLSYEIIRVLYFNMMQRMSGWLPFYVAPDIFWKMPLIGIAAYAVISPLLMRRIKKVPMAQALKSE